MYYRRYRAPSVWQEVERLQREMNRLMESFSPRRIQAAPSFPAMNLWVSDEVSSSPLKYPASSLRTSISVWSMTYLPSVASVNQSQWVKMSVIIAASEDVESLLAQFNYPLPLTPTKWKPTLRTV